jgi:very-short-patch-repair endonuclease
VDLLELLSDLGGVARRRTLLTVVDRAELERAVEAGTVLRDRRGLYVLPDVDLSVRAAAHLGGTLGLTSAALRHGWAVAVVPPLPHVVVSRGRRLPVDAHDVAVVHRAELAPWQVRDGVIVEELALEQCLRRLPYSEALAVADSALREGYGRQRLEAMADRVRGPGSRQVRLVCERADGRAANPFESTVRATSHSVPGLRLVPQQWVTDGAWRVRPDLVDDRLRIVVEADSFEFHGKRSALASDTRRYNMLVVAGWMVLRFCYEDVMYRPGWVRDVLTDATALAELLRNQAPARGRSA